MGKMKNRMLYFLLCIGLLMGVNACGSSANNDASSEPTTRRQEKTSDKAEENETTEEVTTTEATTEAVTTEEVTTEKSDFDELEYRTDISMDSILRKPDDYMDFKIKIAGAVNSCYADDDFNYIQIMNGDDSADFYVVAYDADMLDFRILEGDSVTVYGALKGLGKYETAAGLTKEEPTVLADKIEVSTYDGTADSPTGELKTGQYKGSSTEGDFIYVKTADVTYQDGEAYGISIRVVREIADRGDATILGDFSGFLEESGKSEYTLKVDGGSIKIKVYTDYISVSTTSDSGDNSAFEGMDGDYEFVVN